MSEVDPNAVVQDLAKRKLSTKLGVRKELKRLPDKLEHEEELITLASGSFEGGTGLVVVTNRRLLFLEQGRFKDKLEEFPYDRVASISTEKKLTAGKVKFSISGGGRHEISNVTRKERVDEIAGYVRRRISPGTESAPAPLATPMGSAEAPNDVAARLRRLEDLKAEGLITDEEFQQKRTDLIQEL